MNDVKLLNLVATVNHIDQWTLFEVVIQQLHSEEGSRRSLATWFDHCS
ncbi:unnamed protein product [Musa hybrid cultivar]